MIKRQWVIGCCLTFWAVVFLLIAILAPIILNQLLEEKVKDSVKLTESNNINLWGYLPGKSEAVMYQHYHLYNILNPEEVMEGGVPYLEEKSGYIYQEFDNFTDPEYGQTYNNNKIVRFHLLRYEKITEETVWPSNISSSDQITQVSLGAFGAWYQLKHLTRQQLALTTLYSIALGLEQQLPISGYSLAVSGFLGDFGIAFKIIFEPAGVTNKAYAQQIWEDQFYGLGNAVTIAYWLQALTENMDSIGTYSMATPMLPNTYLLSNYFGLNRTQMNSILTGQLYSAYNLTTLIFYISYDCPNSTVEYVCDPVYLAALQWSQSEITLNPPGGLGEPALSIVTSNPSTTGYPEMYYYYNVTTVSSKYPQYQFTIDDYYRLFYYNRTSGFPAYNQTTLLDVGNLNNFFGNASAGTFGNIQQQQNLTSNATARVLWDYVNALVDYTALQGCSDPNVYNIENRGMSAEASLGTVGSQGLSGVVQQMSQLLSVVVTSIYGALYASDQKILCSTVVNNTIGQSAMCSNPILWWQIDSTGFSYWMQTYWNDINSTYWYKFQNISQLSYADMVTLFKTNNSLTQTFAAIDKYIHDWYNCTNPGNRCDPMYLAKMQWGLSYVTLNLPPIFKTLNIGNSSSMINYQYLKTNLTVAPEYFAFASTRGGKNLTYDQINLLLSQNGLYQQTYFQLYFIYVYRGNYTGITQKFQVEDPLIMTDYLRYLVDQYVFGGLIKAKSVDQILWNDYEPLLYQSLYLNPLLGGNPATDVNQTSIAQNMTQDHFENWPDSFKDGMDSGQTNVNNVRTYRLYGGVPYINFPTYTYMGEGINGSVIEYVNYNPWAAPVPIGGTDAWSFRPYISKDDNVKFFFDVAGLIFDGLYKKEVTQRDFDCLRFGINPAILQNATTNPANAVLYQYGPNGLANQTNVFQAPLFGSKPYFLDGDPMLNSLVNYSDTSLNVPEQYESAFDIELYSGTVIHAMEQIQYNLELRPDPLYPKLGLSNLNNYGYRTYMPMFFLQRSELLSQHIVDKYFGDIHTVLTVILVSQIVGYVLAGVLFITVCVYIWKRQRKLKILNESERGQSLILGRASP